MSNTALHVTATSSPDEGLVLSVEGYLDATGGSNLIREARAVSAADFRRIRIDLDAVSLFNLSGARCLISILRELEGGGRHVDLVGVRPSLRQYLDLTA